METQYNSDFSKKKSKSKQVFVTNNPQQKVGCGKKEKKIIYLE